MAPGGETLPRSSSAVLTTGVSESDLGEVGETVCVVVSWSFCWSELEGTKGGSTDEESADFEPVDDNTEVTGDVVDGFSLDAMPPLVIMLDCWGHSAETDCKPPILVNKLETEGAFKCG